MWQRIKSFLLENKTPQQTVAKNTAWLSISNFGGRLIKATIIIYAARVLGAAGYGVFSYATTLAGFFTLFVDPGINAVLIREGAKATPEERRSLYSTTLLMKAVVIAVSVLIVITVAPFFSILPGAKVLLPFVALIIIFDSTRGFLSRSSMLKRKWNGTPPRSSQRASALSSLDLSSLSGRRPRSRLREPTSLARPLARPWRSGSCEQGSEACSRARPRSA